MQKKVLRHFFPFLLFISWLIVSTILLTLPGSAFPSDDWMSRIYFDKWIHIGMFGAGTIVLCRGFWKNGSVRLDPLFLMSAAICLGYGIVMEFVQKYLVAHRGFDVGDIVADAVGVIAGWAISRKVYIKK